jgi:hypothetical protein
MFVVDLLLSLIAYVPALHFQYFLSITQSSCVAFFFLWSLQHSSLFNVRKRIDLYTKEVRVVIETVPRAYHTSPLALEEFPAFPPLLRFVNYQQVLPNAPKIAMTAAVFIILITDSVVNLMVIIIIILLLFVVVVVQERNITCSFRSGSSKRSLPRLHPCRCRPVVAAPSIAVFGTFQCA